MFGHQNGEWRMDDYRMANNNTLVNVRLDGRCEGGIVQQKDDGGG